MKEKPAIVPLKYLVIDFYEWLKCFASGSGKYLIGAIKLQPIVYQMSLNLIP